MKYPDTNYWGKLRQLLKFLNQIIGEDRIIGAGNIYEMLTCMDASKNTHDGTRGHTDDCMTFFGGLIHEKPSK